MKEFQSNNNILVNSTLAIAFILVSVAIHMMKPVLVPFVFGIFQYLVMLPVIEWQTRVLRFPKSLATTISFLITLCALIGIFVIVGTSAKQIINDSEQYKSSIASYIDVASNFAEQKNISIDFKPIKKELNSIPVVKIATNITSEVFSFIGSVILVFIFTLFLLLSKRMPTDEPWIDQDIQNSITQYLFVKFMISILAGIVMGTVLIIFKIPFALLFAACAFLLNFIPSVGPIIAGLLPFPMVLFEYGFGFELLIITIITFTSKFVIGNILEPKIMGENLGIHPIVILISLFFWGVIWGLPGMFLSVPLTSIMKILCARSNRFKPIAKAIEGKISLG